MTGETVPQSRSGPNPEPRNRSGRPGTSALIQGLERLRESLQARLDQIEAMVRERKAAAPGTDPAREREILARFAEIEDAQRRLRTESERWDREKQSYAEQLEHDRRLLAEAWERLECEQVENHQPASRPAPNQDRQSLAAPRPHTLPDRDDPISQAILQQFQTLRRDVRKNSNGHRHG